MRDHRAIAPNSSALIGLSYPVLRNANHQVQTTRGTPVRWGRFCRTERAVLDIEPDHVVSDMADYLDEPRIYNTADGQPLLGNCLRAASAKLCF